MAKQGATKNRGKRKPKKDRKRAKAQDPLDVGADADLRTVPAHLNAWRTGQRDEATTTLIGMGRDAAFLVQEAAKDADDPELTELARKLAAIPPQVETNLTALRLHAVSERVEDAKAEAPLLVDVPSHSAVGGAIGLFDPMRVQEDLAKSGRPRRDAERLSAGHVAWFGLPSAEATEVRLSTEPPPEGQATRRLRLDVVSGVVFVGRPEASDGPRLGTVRLDPFHTALDAHEGRFARLKAGVYAVHGYLGPDGGLRIHVIPDSSPQEALEVDPGSLGDVPS